MIARRNRPILSPVQQHQSPPQHDSPLHTNSAQFHGACFSFKLGEPGPSLLPSAPRNYPRVSCFVEIPLGRMALSSPGAGVKRKRANVTGSKSKAKANDRSGTGPLRNQRAAHTERGGHTDASSSLSLGRRRGFLPATPRKPASTASNTSDWSSLASTSPAASRHATLPEVHDDLVDSWLQSERGSGRSSSRVSLRQGMRGMTLEDPPSPTGTASGSGGDVDVDGKATGAQKPVRRGSRTRSQRSVDYGTGAPLFAEDGAAAGESGEAEDQRLLTTAPNWQLSRLRKDDLVRLNRLAGTWDDDEEVDPELYTKQELVNGVIMCRSRLDKGKGAVADAGARGHRRAASASSSSSSLRARGSAVIDLTNELPSPPRLRTRSRSRTRRTGVADPEATTKEQSRRPSGDSSDESHEGGGEETEAEPTRAAGRKKAARRPQPGTLRRMDSSFFEPSELMQHAPNGDPTKARWQQSDPIGRADRTLRARTALGTNRADRRGRDRSIFGSSDAGANASSSSLAFTSSGISPLGSHMVRRRGSRRSLFVASSPVRASSRGQGGVAPRRRPMTRATAAALQEMFGDGAISSSRTPRPARKAGRGVSFRTGDERIGDPDDMDEDWSEEEASRSDGSGKRRTVATRRQTRARARQVGHHELSADDADCELVSQLSVAEEESEDETGEQRNGSRPRAPGRRGSRPATDGAEIDQNDATPVRADRAPRAARRGSQSGHRRGAAKTVSPGQTMGEIDGQDEDDDDDNDDDDDDDDDNSEASSTEADDSPVKFRKLRNGKLRMPVSRRDAMAVDQDQEANAEREPREETGDCEMGAADAEHADDAGDDPVARSSPAIEDAMFEPTSGSLARLRRAQLVDLQGSDVDDAATPRTRKQARTRGDAAGGKGAAQPTESEVPLLLRAKADKVESSKLPTPPLTSHNDEANAAGAGDGVDELNGLDLESLDLQDKEIPPSKLEKLEKIGSGGFKDVYVGRYRISKTRVNRVAIADIRDQLTEMDIKELSLLRDLRHENIVRFIGVSIPDDPRTSVPCMIVSELCVNGDLFDYIRNTAPPSDDEVFRILLETARGLEYLHTRTPAIIHRDCKSTNVLITRNRTAKINDFGLAKVKNTQRSMMRSLVGTVNWQAAELWVPKPHYNEKVDVWSAAMTFWETLQWHQAEKKYPFQGMNEHQIYQDVGQKRIRPYTGAIRRQFGGEIVDLLDAMWHHSAKERPSMTQVCERLEELVRIKRAQLGGKRS
ncbi:uncharacterized protein PFL1_06944 [Pseudozyma flocculosa PF-1]|uniref:uncharacterized protein n=1 Tax=Pseudozyma flocculosa PF-1 TaxID=1277687 RepID=UPI0004560B69|nr:uncharacterized protein PFL1_06944 [Pseudozyma flocculosa PF-1]EPQ30374.1 hypothetical protein PFL1_06944 [Pseudozyma flocculosa PF-1]